ncbi:hypothetical protein C1645_830040 [Glomus cerebriforme]|uniref:Uncharacterized protein n=1 Tax=Glomus cerebriforme TaxID=658196 RepID=A0A397SJW9_9GLOM|nr:hypothetical protein C1645_830040 [Glomus cerebriforme]
MLANYQSSTSKPIFWKAVETKEKRHTGVYIAQQFEMKLYDPTITLAYYFDLKYRENFLAQDHSIMSYILGKASKLTDEEVENSIIWWKVMQAESPIIGVIASKLMSIPAS